MNSVALLERLRLTPEQALARANRPSANVAAQIELQKRDEAGRGKKPPVELTNSASPLARRIGLARS